MLSYCDGVSDKENGCQSFLSNVLVQREAVAPPVEKGQPLSCPMACSDQEAVADIQLYGFQASFLGSLAIFWIFFPSWDSATLT